MENGEERPDIITLVDDEGNEHDFVLIDLFPVNMKQYAILSPLRDDQDDDEDEDDPDEEAYIFRLDTCGESGEETLVEVEDEAEWDLVAREWESRA